MMMDFDNQLIWKTSFLICLYYYHRYYLMENQTSDWSLLLVCFLGLKYLSQVYHNYYDNFSGVSCLNKYVLNDYCFNTLTSI